MDLAYVLTGALTGFIVGLTGVGGGALMTPILLLIFGITPTVAVATDLWFATLTKCAALFVHRREQQIDWRVVCRLWSGSLPMAFIVVIALSTGVLSAMHSRVLTVLIGSIILLTAMGLLFKSWLMQHLKIQDMDGKPRLQSVLTTLAGGVIGLLVSLTSVGAGALGSVFMLYLYPKGMTSNRLVGTDIAHAVPLALLAGVGYLYAGHVDTHLLRNLLIGSLPAATVGSVIATRLSSGRLRYFIAAILSLSGLKLLMF